MASSKKKSSKKPATRPSTQKKSAAPAKKAPAKKAPAKKAPAKKAPAKKAPAKKAPAKKAPANPVRATGKPAPSSAVPKETATTGTSPSPTRRAPAKSKHPTAGDAWDNAAMAPKVAASSPQPRMTEPSKSPPHALHDHTGGLVSPVDDEEELAERVHGGEEATKDEDLDDDSGSPRLDDREDADDE